jgi:GNAT superfamily N-acetyltransferase
MGEYALREAGLGDVAVLAYQRRAMFEEMGVLAAADAPGLEAAVRAFLERTLATGEFRAWVIEHGGQVVAGGGVLVRPLMPRPGHGDGEAEGLVVSMWTEPAHRHRGLGGRVLERILAACRERGVRRVALHASDAGRPLYARAGFRASNEMLRVERPG